MTKNTIEQQLNNLEKRISRLENILNGNNNNSNQYSGSNYYMV